MSKANDLYVVVAFANPVRWASRMKLYKAFEQHMLDSGVNLIVVECAYADRDWDMQPGPNVTHVKVRASARHLIWNKESLLNIGVAHAPPEAKKFGIFDADIMFRRPDFAAETSYALDHYHVVQPWEWAYDLGPDGGHMELHKSFASMFYNNEPIVQGPKCGPGTPYRFAHPGFAWAFTRQALDWTGGLLETAALGAADHHMAMALINRADDSIHGAMSQGYKAPIYLWQDRAVNHIQRNIGYIHGTIEHSFHGAKPKRGYTDRWNVLIKANFDPFYDMKRNTYAVMELVGNKPELTREVDRYFHSRDEDSNSLG